MKVLRNDPIRGGRWCLHSDGSEVFEFVFSGHVWRGLTTTTPVCVFCKALYYKIEDPSWAKCPERGDPVVLQRRWPFASLPFPSQVARSILQVDSLPEVPLAFYPVGAEPRPINPIPMALNGMPEAAFYLDSDEMSVWPDAHPAIEALLEVSAQPPDVVQTTGTGRGLPNLSSRESRAGLPDPPEETS